MIDVVIDLAGLLGAAALLFTLVALEVGRTQPGTGQPARPRIFGRTVGPRVVAAMWVVYVILFLPRVLGLLV
ncbi:hypothetical protein LJR013_002487 [Pseudarthrobacter oxydans]|jgi:hypothetical protein|uniref:Uncharacterized protein n=1 Tax=Pseudarthrobacter oxydans TaxID=1671 RepID=A0AAW8N9A1_PSEOX|nr:MULTISPECIES: hypothetical protein [Pseudarthrobacter]MDV2979664.1 hypothetical protein [Actinomycetes bacterium ARC8]MDR6792941.1 hypothetical protein [Pseudarthrobacter oxydans]MDR7163827.1 hypothetical protein [Pseudarthrobacter oxydans]NSX35663.1 hypothetical protein [Pseudarthrobacter oxydans]GKV73169.1 hypothetical protein NCCP2145_25500 [Pseudarthrobacter sp. NCCP-2145]